MWSSCTYIHKNQNVIYNSNVINFVFVENIDKKKLMFLKGLSLSDVKPYLLMKIAL